MCTLLLAFDPAAPLPVIVAANRDEFRSRPTRHPYDWGDGVFAGRDGRAGGTWLAVAHGRVAAVTNVRGAQLRPEAPSRGMLPLAAIRDELPRRFDGWNPFNLVVASPDGVRVLTYDGRGGGAREVTLAPGAHAIVNDPFGAETPRAEEAAALVRGRGAGFDALASHGDAERSLCRHGDDYGTVSATVVALDRAGWPVRYHYRAGPPCMSVEHDLGRRARRAVGRPDAPES